MLVEESLTVSDVICWSIDTESRIATGMVGAGDSLLLAPMDRSDVLVEKSSPTESAEEEVSVSIGGAEEN